MKKAIKALVILGLLVLINNLYDFKYAQAEDEIEIHYTNEDVIINTVPYSHYVLSGQTTFRPNEAPEGLYDTEMNGQVGANGKLIIKRSNIDGPKKKKIRFYELDGITGRFIREIGEQQLQVRDNSPLEVEYSDFENVFERKKFSIRTKFNADITVYVNGEQVYSTFGDGMMYYVDLLIPQVKIDDKIVVEVKDEAGNQYKSDTLVVESPIKSEQVRTYTRITDQTSTVEVYAPRHSTGKVDIINENGDVIGSGTNNQNRFKIKIPKQKEGTKLNLISYDEAGVTSKSNEVEVADGTPPSLPKVTNVYDTQIYFTGKGDPNINIYIGKPVVNKVDKTVGVGITDAKGNFKIKVGKLKAGDTYNVSAYDKANNWTKVVKVIIGDKTPPKIPTVKPVKQNSKTMIGTGEPNAKVYIYKGSKLIGSATVNKEGQFFAKITMQKKKTVLLVSSMDRAGNESKERKVVVQ